MTRSFGGGIQPKRFLARADIAFVTLTAVHIHGFAVSRLLTDYCCGYQEPRKMQRVVGRTTCQHSTDRLLDFTWTSAGMMGLA